MTSSTDTPKVVKALEKVFLGCVVEHDKESIWVDSEKILEICTYLHKQTDFNFDLLVSLTAVDYIDHFEVVYRLRSLLYNTCLVLKTKVGFGRSKPTLSSVYSVWRGADLMEREVFDLMGVQFSSHPNLKRIMLWDGFPGHPLRKDYLYYEQSFVEKGGE